MDMTVAEALQKAQKSLKKPGIDLDAAWLEAELLLAFALKKDRTWLVAHKEELLSPSKERAFFRFVARREQHEPIAYILGTKEFCGLSFEVNRQVLIPRPETEGMVDLIGDRTHATRPYDSDRTTVLDVGTGSGAIAVSVKKMLPLAHVIASDVSRRALSLARKNAARILGSNHGIDFLQGSLLTREIQARIISKQPKTLLILANLPYLPLSDIQMLEKDVVDFEPRQALFTEEGGNALILKLMKQLARFFAHHPINTQMIFEFDPPQAKALKILAEKIFPTSTVEVREDGCGRERFLVVILSVVPSEV